MLKTLSAEYSARKLFGHPLSVGSGEVDSASSFAARIYRLTFEAKMNPSFEHLTRERGHALVEPEEDDIDDPPRG